MTIFFEVVLPVLLVFLAGYLLQYWKRVDIKPISTIAIYVMTPALVFRTFYQADVNMQYLYMAIFALILLFSLIILNKLYSRISNYPTKTESGLILSTAFMNSGNYGAPIILFAYGEAGFAFAIIFMVLQSIIMNFFGVYYAAKGLTGFRTAIKVIFTLPATYAVILALLFKSTGVKLPNTFLLPLDIISEATIPTVMILLGMQLAKIKWESFEWSKISFGVMMRLIISPIIAFVITIFLPMDPLLAKVLIVLAATPSAATMVMYSVEFNSEPKLVSSITLVSTLISIFTITLLISLLEILF
ncbi:MULTISPECIES: AEC family transporter [Bacillaceae]|uniref:AEC family transporter n=1 Tax=Evansella alkalicola TaxID=745819 RepID=A0ABS6JW94_9BACI|nr:MULTISPECIES: AEC family transporter [Bacillaceae]MBU9722861.1 AEC family transporter [Bacillus alkalicola]